ncbi:MAG: hypothetical protein ACLFTR_03370 [Candidatus Woesearchaeota archaeon]
MSRLLSLLLDIGLVVVDSRDKQTIRFNEKKRKRKPVRWFISFPMIIIVIPRQKPWRHWVHNLIRPGSTEEDTEVD